MLLPAFGHYLGLHYPWNYIAISAALLGAGCLVLLHTEGASDQAVNVSMVSDCFGAAILVLLHTEGACVASVLLDTFSVLDKREYLYML